MVSTFGSSNWDTQTGSPTPGLCSAQAADTRLLASSTSWARMPLRTFQRSESLTADDIQSTAVVSESPSRSEARATREESVQVGACTPFVTEVIGTSAVSNPGQSSPNISRLTSPCSFETPLARWPSRRPMTAMLKVFGVPPS